MATIAEHTRVPRVAARDEEHFNRIVREHRHTLLAYVSRLCGGDRAQAEDVIQETFLRAWHHLDSLVPERGSVYGWLRRVAHNLVVDGHRMRQARPTELELTSQHTAVATAPDRGEAVLDTILLGTLLGRVSRSHQAALVETYLRDRTTAEAAAVLRVPVGTVKSRAHHGLRALRVEAGRLGLAASGGLGSPL